MCKVASQLPPPPPYYRSFATSSEAMTPPRVPESALAPGGRYVVFGEVLTLELEAPNDLQEKNVAMLYSLENDPVVELKKLNAKILFKYLELVDLMTLHPERAAPKIEEIRQLFVNAFHLLNEFRETQARDSIIWHLGNQIQQRKKAIEQLKLQMKESVAKLEFEIEKLNSN